MTFAWDKESSRPALDLTTDKAVESLKLTTIGHDDEIADTMFVILVNDERYLIKRPEPLLVTFLSALIESGKMTLLTSERTFKVDVDQSMDSLKETKQQVEDGLEDAPLGP